MRRNTLLREEGVLWSCIKKTRCHSAITSELKKEICNWVLHHPHVIVSPITNDTLKIKHPESGKLETVYKLLLQISVHKLHNDLIKSPDDGGLARVRKDDGKVIVRDTSLQTFPP